MAEQPPQQPAKKSSTRAASEHAPWKPPAYEPSDAYSLQALYRGEASPEQQRDALKWIIEQACGTYDFPYRPGQDGERETTLALGRMFVGQQIVKLLKLNLKQLRR